MAQTAPAPLRSFLEIVWKRLTVSPRRHLIYAQTPRGSTGFHMVGRIFEATSLPGLAAGPALSYHRGAS